MSVVDYTKQFTNEYEVNKYDNIIYKKLEKDQARNYGTKHESIVEDKKDISVSRNELLKRLTT